MPLHLITGPPNSGRTERLRELFIQAERRGPVLVVPSVGDIFSWERRLTDPDGAFIGARVFHFRDLCAEIIRRSGSRRKPLVSSFRRRQIMARAVERAWPDQASRLSTQPGFLDSLLDLVDDFRTEEILTQEELRARIDEAGLSGLGKVEAVFGAYLEELGRSGGTDMPELISTAVRLLPGAWSAGSPLFMAGFDDLTGQQLEMVRRLSSGEQGVDVTIAVTHEPDNPGTAVSNRLVNALQELGKACGLTEERLERSDSEAEIDPLLDRVSGRFLRPTGGDEGLLEPDEAISLIEAAGTRNEAEAIGSEVARLLDAGVEPGSIGIAISTPGAGGRLIREILERYDIPVALEAEIAATATIVGSSIAALTEAVRHDSLEGLLFWLRSPIGGPREQVDRLEFYCRRDSERSARKAVSRFHRMGGEVVGWEDLIAALDSGGSAIATVRDLTEALVEAILVEDPSRPPSQETVLEVRIAGALKQAIEELGDLEANGGRQLDALLDALECDAVTVWSSSSGGTVTIASPYGMRGKRFGYLFMAGLQESGSDDPERPGPFLSSKSRSALGMSTKADREDQERYLFYSCLTVPTERLWLSFTSSDETGKATRPSPLVAAVEALFDGSLRRILRTGRTPVFPVDVAPTEREVARSFAAGLDLPGDFAETPAGTTIEGEVIRARRLAERTAILGSLQNGNLIDALAGDRTLSPTRIESWVRCPYRWYVEKAVRPDQLGPESDYLTLGTAIHEVLRRLYEKHPDTRPDNGNLTVWLADIDSCIDEIREDPRSGLAGDDVRSRVMRLRVRRLTELLLRSEADHPRDSFLPKLFEFDFGPIDLDGTGTWKLAGKIDRIDVAGPDEDHEGGRALVIDYKSGSVDRYKRAEAIESGLIQMILYLAAASSIAELGEAATVGGLYLPVSGTKARGGLESGLYGSAKDWNFYRTEAEGDLDQWLEEGLSLAGEGANGILGGVMEHDSVACRDHFKHAAVPDWSPADAGEPEEED